MVGGVFKTLMLYVEFFYSLIIKFYNYKCLLRIFLITQNGSLKLKFENNFFY
jgi:hypothetical protein